MNDLGEVKYLRVSIATYNRVLFEHSEDGTQMLALERQATVLEDGSVNVRAQPFGGGIRLCGLADEITRARTIASAGAEFFRILLEV